MRYEPARRLLHNQRTALKCQQVTLARVIRGICTLAKTHVLPICVMTVISGHRGKSIVATTAQQP